MFKLRKFKSNKHRTTFLLPHHSFIVGAGSIFNVAGNYFDLKLSKTEDAADTKAIASDWGVIGDDLKKSFESHSNDCLILTHI